VLPVVAVLITNAVSRPGVMVSNDAAAMYADRDSRIDVIEIPWIEAAILQHTFSASRRLQFGAY
jgi:hypothetical protein